MKVHLKSDRGIALPTVIMVMLVVCTFAAIVIKLVVSQTDTEVLYESNVKALHAAETGVNQYLWYLNKRDTASFSFNTDIPYPDVNPEYVYNIESIQDSTDKKVIKSTGWYASDPDVKRTVTVTFTQKSLAKFVYFTDEEDDTIYWTTGESCYGPYHTNTNLNIWGSPVFYGEVSFKGAINYKAGVFNNPDFRMGYEQREEDFPKDNIQLAILAKKNGYYYTGQTRIRLNSDGTITVKTKPQSSTVFTVTTVPLPPNGVIYVGGTLGTTFDEAAGNAFIAGTLNGRLTVGAANDIIITDYDPIPDNRTTQLNGLRYADTDFSLDPITGVVSKKGSAQDDMLGLVAKQNITLLTRGWFNDAWAISAHGDLYIYAAMMAVNGSFGNPNWWYLPDPGAKIILYGSLSQKYRAAVGYGTLGYSKVYAHDPRMMYDSPPSYNPPEISGWEISVWE